MYLFWEATRLTSSRALAMSTAGAKGYKEWRRRCCNLLDPVAYLTPAVSSYMTLSTTVTRKFCILNVHFSPGSGTTLLFLSVLMLLGRPIPVFFDLLPVLLRWETSECDLRATISIRCVAFARTTYCQEDRAVGCDTGVCNPFHKSMLPETSGHAVEEAQHCALQRPEKSRIRVPGSKLGFGSEFIRGYIRGR